jgi:hypothetical protein
MRHLSRFLPDAKHVLSNPSADAIMQAKQPHGLEAHPTTSLDSALQRRTILFFWQAFSCTGSYNPIFFKALYLLAVSLNFSLYLF